MSQTATKDRSSSFDEFAAKPAPVGDGEQLPVAIEPHTLAILSRSEIDAQLATAGTRPRDISTFRQTVMQIATTNEEVAADCMYSLPARKEDGDPIEGPSVRWAEILAYSWRNSRVGARVIEEAFDHVTAQGIFHDVETNTVSTFEVRRRITGRSGRRYSADMINVTANAACAIARRNAILQSIPKPLWADLFERTKAVAAGTVSQLEDRVNKAIYAFEEIGVSEAQILNMLHVKNRLDIKVSDYSRLRGIYTAVKDGTITIRDLAAPAQQQDIQSEASAKSALDTFASGAPVEGDAPPDDARDTGAGGDRPPPHQAPPATDLRQEYVNCIKQLLKVATDKSVEVDERLAILDGALVDWIEKTGAPSFVEQVVNACAKVATGKLKEADARHLMEGLLP